MSRTSSDQLKKEHEENELPTAIAVTEVEESKPLCTDDESTSYKLYLTTHKTKLAEVKEAIRYTLKNHILYRPHVSKESYDTGIDMTQLRESYRDIHYSTRFMHSLFSSHKHRWFSKQELGTIQYLNFDFHVSKLGKLEITIEFDPWNTCDVIWYHICFCCCCVKLYWYHTRNNN